MSASRSFAAIALAVGLGAATSVVAVDDSWFSRLHSEDIIGKSVVSASGESIAEVDGLVIDPVSKDLYVILSVGSPPGRDAKEVAVPMKELRPGDNQRLVMRRGGREALENRPAYVEDQEPYAPLHAGQSLAELPF